MNVAEPDDGGGTRSSARPEPYALIVEQIHDVVGRRPVILCGSRATDSAAEDSDFDIAVVVPAHAAPVVAGRLAEAARSLESRLGVGMSVNPLPRRLLRRPESNLFVWKLRRESRLLWGPDGFRIPPPVKPSATEESAFSYLLSGAFYLVEALSPQQLRDERLPPRVSRGVGKALLHVLQLRLMRRGQYASGLREAVAALGDPSLASLATRLESPASWFAVRSELLSDLGPRPPTCPPARALVRNGQYAALSALRGRSRWWALGSLHAVDRHLAVTTVRLLSAVREGGTIDGAAVAAAASALPSRLRPRSSGDWHELRELCSGEWASAHPLLGL